MLESIRSEDPGEEDDEAENDSPKEPTEKTSAPSSFTVIGGFENKSVQKVRQCVVRGQDHVGPELMRTIDI